MTISIAIAGKGGTGKTTFSSLLIRCLKEAGLRPILAVDADPNSNLADALGVDEGKPLAEIREHGSSPEGSPASGVGRARALDDELQRAITEADGFDVISMGRPEGPRCYCYVNNLLRKSLDELSRNYEAVVVDNEAGMEHLSRRTTNNVDFLIAVTNPTLPSLRAAKRVVALSHELPVNIGQRALVVTRVGPNGMEQPLVEKLTEIDAQRLPDIPQDEHIERANAVGEDVFTLPVDNPALAVVRSLVEQLRAPAK